MMLLSLLPFLLIAGSEAATCNPLKSTDCSPVKALASSFKETFSEKSEYFSAQHSENGIDYSDDGLTLTLAKRFDNPGLKSNFYIMFGRVEVVFKAAEGKGVISSFFLQSDDLDEVDLEWFGGDQYEVQSNYFSKGNTATYDRGEYHPIPNPMADFHTYTLDWTKDSLSWYFDGDLLRTLDSDNSQGYPQSPMALYMGIWAGGDPSNAPGTIDWAGGETDYSQAPFKMQIQSLIVTDYSTGSEYSYSDQSGKWTAIEAKDGEVNARESEAEEEFEKLTDGETINAASVSFSPESSTVASSSEPATSSVVSSTSSADATSSQVTSSLESSSAETTSAQVTFSTSVESSSAETSSEVSSSTETSETSSSETSSGATSAEVTSRSESSEASTLNTSTVVSPSETASTVQATSAVQAAAFSQSSQGSTLTASSSTSVSESAEASTSGAQSTRPDVSTFDNVGVSVFPRKSMISMILSAPLLLISLTVF